LLAFTLILQVFAIIISSLISDLNCTAATLLLNPSSRYSFDYVPTQDRIVGET